MVFTQYEIQPTSEPAPENYEEEVKTLNQVLDDVESLPQENLPTELEKYEWITSWVAWQLGIVAEVVSSQGDHLKALKIAMVSIDAARKIRSWDRLYANYLTLGNIWVKVGDYEEAVSVYQHLLELPYAGGTNERAGAHLNLANLFVSREQPDRAIYHYERALARIKPVISAEVYSNMVSNLARLYAQMEDVAGMVFCVKELRLGDAGKLLDEYLQNPLVLDDTLNLTTRLYSLGENKMAEHVFRNWKEKNNGKGNL
jgi:tetratricopeptide (TPR) repeat protein